MKTPRREFTIAALHLFTLVGFAVVQPLLEVLKQDATFFVARRSLEVDLYALALGSVLLLPLPLLAMEALAGLAGRTWRRRLHLAFVAALTALVLLPPMKRLGEAAGWSLPLAVAGGGLAAFAYARASPVRTFLTVLSPAPLVFAGLFLIHPSIAKLLTGADGAFPSAQVDSDTTVVMVVLDELPITSLVDESWEIDSELFPNFARLASHATWFRNATTRHNASELAVPTILTGRNPSDPDRLPIAADHPRNLFSFLSGSYRMNVWETFTGLRSLSDDEETAGPGLADRMRALSEDLLVVYGHIVLPRDLAARLPSVESTWGGFGTADRLVASHRDLGEGERGFHSRPFGLDTRYPDRTAVFRGFIDSIDASDEPTLHFLHVLFPHRPWSRLPTGQEYAYEDDGTPGQIGLVWSDESEWLPASGFQRHLLQLGHVDRLLGELIDRLQALGRYDSSLILLVADHGICFRRNEPVRGGLGTSDSVRDILHVPLFVKEPFQEEARTSDRNVETIDVLPTIADVLGIEIPWPIDGVSALDLSAPERSEKVLYRYGVETPIVVPGALPTDWPALENKARLFGHASGWDGVYAMGPRPELLGRPVRELELVAPLGARISLVDGRRYDSVDPEASMLPTFVEGRFFAQRTPLPAEIVVAIDGTVRAVTTIYRSQAGMMFSAMVAPSALGMGRNTVEIFGLLDGSKLAPLVGYVLEEDRIVASDGQSFELVPGAFESSVEAIAAHGHLVLKGWAANLAAGLPADTLVVFFDGAECVLVAPMNRHRHAIQEGLASPSEPIGFRYLLPLDITSESVPRRVRPFVLGGSVATELELE